MDKYLICTAFSDNEHNEIPSNFTLKIDEDIINKIEELSKIVKKSCKLSNGTLSKSTFYFPHGTWTNETFSENFELDLQDDLQLVEDIDFDFLNFEYDNIESLKIEIYHDGDFRFVCYEKYSMFLIYTSIISLEDLK